MYPDQETHELVPAITLTLSRTSALTFFSMDEELARQKSVEAGNRDAQRIINQIGADLERMGWEIVDWSAKSYIDAKW